MANFWHANPKSLALLFKPKAGIFVDSFQKLKRYGPSMRMECAHYLWVIVHSVREIIENKLSEEIFYCSLFQVDIHSIWIYRTENKMYQTVRSHLASSTKVKLIPAKTLTSRFDKSLHKTTNPVGWVTTKDISINDSFTVSLLILCFCYHYIPRSFSMPWT